MSGFEVEHRLTIQATCPVDGTADAYNCLVSLDRVVSVEAILLAVELVTFEPAFQEDITRELASLLSAEVVTHGIHSGVYTTCRCLG
jgi:GTP cyclohydrolase I